MLTPSTTNWRPSLFCRLWTHQKLQEIVFAKSATLGVKGILLSLVQAMSLDANGTSITIDDFFFQDLKHEKTFYYNHSMCGMVLWMEVCTR